MSFNFDDNNTNRNTNNNMNNDQEIWGFEFDDGNYSDMTSNNEGTGLQPQQNFDIDDAQMNKRKQEECRKRGNKKTPDTSGKFLYVLGVVAVIIFLCVIFRRQITEFLMTVLSWVIIILILYLILRLIFFPRRRR